MRHYRTLSCPFKSKQSTFCIDRMEKKSKTKIQNKLGTKLNNRSIIFQSNNIFNQISTQNGKVTETDGTERSPEVESIGKLWLFVSFISTNIQYIFVFISYNGAKVTYFFISFEISVLFWQVQVRKCLRFYKHWAGL